MAEQTAYATKIVSSALGYAFSKVVWDIYPEHYLKI